MSVLEREFKSESVTLDAGDLVVFNCGKISPGDTRLKVRF